MALLTYAGRYTDARHCLSCLHQMVPDINSLLCRRRKRSTATSTIDTPGPDFPSQVAGTAAATGCRAAVSIAALAMRDTSPDAWFQTLCDSQKAAEDQSLAQPHDARHRHSSGGSEQSVTEPSTYLIDQQVRPLPCHVHTLAQRDRCTEWSCLRCTNIILVQEHVSMPVLFSLS
jgi:hypothetical protein